jgi:TldD protein
MSRSTRREFLVTSAKGLALASIPLMFKVDPAMAFESPADTGGTMSSYMNHFKVNPELIAKVMEKAMSRGGDYCDLYFQHSISNQIGLEDDIVNRAHSSVDFGVGIRVLKGEQTGYSFTEVITEEAMLKAAATAAGIASGGSGTNPAKPVQIDTPNYYRVETRWEDVSIDRKIPCLTKINRIMAEADSRIIKTSVWFTDANDYIMVATSDGRLVTDYRPITRTFANCTAEQNGRREEGGHKIGGRWGIEYYSDAKLRELAETAVRRTLQLFEAVTPDGGEQPVVLAPGNSGILLHEAIGHGMEADFNRKGESIFSDKIGKPVAEPFVTIVDDGTNANLRGSINIDDEANPTEKTHLVKDGTLVSYLHDRISSKHYGVKPTGSGRRQSFRHVPVPRMRNTYMEAGPHDPEEIIRSVKKGLYAESFANGEVHIGPGDFTFFLKSGYIIENGKLGAPVKDVNIIGNGPEVLRRIVMVGNDMELMDGGGTCGKAGQWVPVTFGLPTVKVSAINVGGAGA